MVSNGSSISIVFQWKMGDSPGGVAIFTDDDAILTRAETFARISSRRDHLRLGWSYHEFRHERNLPWDVVFPGCCGMLLALFPPVRGGSSHRPSREGHLGNIGVSISLDDY